MTSEKHRFMSDHHQAKSNEQRPIHVSLLTYKLIILLLNKSICRPRPNARATGHPYRIVNIASENLTLVEYFLLSFAVLIRLHGIVRGCGNARRGKRPAGCQWSVRRTTCTEEDLRYAVGDDLQLSLRIEQSKEARESFLPVDQSEKRNTIAMKLFARTALINDVSIYYPHPPYRTTPVALSGTQSVTSIDILLCSFSIAMFLNIDTSNRLFYCFIERANLLSSSSDRGALILAEPR